MYSVRSVTSRNEQSPFLATEVATPNEQWTQSEYMGPSQLPIAVVSIACGLVIVLLLAYIVYLHRSRCKLMMAHGRKQMRRITRRTPFEAVHDNLPDRLDALEKALRDDASSTNIFADERGKGDAFYHDSFHGEKSSFKHQRSLSLSSWTPALPSPNTFQESLLSRESIYSQQGISLIAGSRTLPTIKIHQPDSPSLSFDIASRPRSTASTPAESISSQQEPHGQPGEYHSPPEAETFILPEQRHPSFSSMIEHLTDDESDESEVDNPLNSKQARLSIRLIPPHDVAASHTGCFESTLNTPAPSLNSGPSSPALRPTFEEFSDCLESIRQSIICPKGAVTTTLDEVHEEIQRSYRTFLGMVEQGLFDSPKGFPEKDQARRTTSALVHDPEATTPPDERVTAWLQDLDLDPSSDKEGSGELSTRLVSMIINDLRSRASVAVDDSYHPSLSGNDTTLPRSRNPVKPQLEKETAATIHVDTPTFSLHSSMSLDTARQGFHVDMTYPTSLDHSRSLPNLNRTASCNTRSQAALTSSPLPCDYWSELSYLDHTYSPS